MTLTRPIRRLRALAMIFALGASACGGESSSAPIPDPASRAQPAADRADAGVSPDLSVRGDAAAPLPDSAPAASDAATPQGSDGMPARAPCTQAFGNALSNAFGRLDGYLVAVVPPTQHGCSADAGHLHLQIKVQSDVYDVAITLVSDQKATSPEVYLAERDAAIANGAWSEGWHPGDRFDYAGNLGLHAADFTPLQKAPLLQRLEAGLAGVNHISIYATGYGPTGAHKVHRNGGGTDGALVLQPTSPTPHILAFHFATQTF